VDKGSAVLHLVLVVALEHDDVMALASEVDGDLVDVECCYDYQKHSDIPADIHHSDSVHSSCSIDLEYFGSTVCNGTCTE
jgi:hypothetical protein